MSLLNTILLVLFIACLLTDISVNIVKDYKGKSASQKRQERQDIHNASQKGINYIKSFISEAIITAAKDNHYSTGLSKKVAVKDLVVKALKEAHLDVPDYLIDVLIQSAYETTKDFIRTNHIDSRDNQTTGPAEMSTNDVVNKINGSK